MASYRVREGAVTAADSFTAYLNQEQLQIIAHLQYN